jgi:hypothetical protein
VTAQPRSPDQCQCVPSCASSCVVSAFAVLAAAEFVDVERDDGEGGVGTERCNVVYFVAVRVKRLQFGQLVNAVQRGKPRVTTVIRCCNCNRDSGLVQYGFGGVPYLLFDTSSSRSAGRHWHA